MSELTNQPRPRPSWRPPIAYSASVAEPPRFPRLVALRTSPGYLIGVGLVWHRQSYIAWKRFH